MQKLLVFNLVTLDGYFAGLGGDISWHHVDEEFQEFANKNSNAGATLLFGRVTYQLMASYWPTPQAIKEDPIVAQGMNKAQKVVFSKTLAKAEWNNTRLIKDDMLGEVRRMKQGSGVGLTVLGSGSIVSQLTQEGLIDEYQILLNPVVLGEGKTMFEGIKKQPTFKLTGTRTFGNGSFLLTYSAAGRLTILPICS